MTDPAPTSLMTDTEAAAHLRWWLEAGATVALSDDATSWLKVPTPPAVVMPSTNNRPEEAEPIPSPPKALTSDISHLANISSLAQLKDTVLGYEQCPLKATATSTVFADGKPESRVMLIGEAPGADEDRVGRPFVGEAGRLLDRMMTTINRSRDGDSMQSFYITNVVFWRPPGNRTPTMQEIQLCLPFLLKHIELVDPVAIFTLGAVPFQALVNAKEGITRARGVWRTLDINGKDYPLLPTLHPAFLLRQPLQKANVWQDLQNLRRFLETGQK
jgi:uracil-DNA glycosylase